MKIVVAVASRSRIPLATALALGISLLPLCAQTTKKPPPLKPPAILLPPGVTPQPPPPARPATKSKPPRTQERVPWNNPLFAKMQAEAKEVMDWEYSFAGTLRDQGYEDLSHDDLQTNVHMAQRINRYSYLAREQDFNRPFLTQDQMDDYEANLRRFRENKSQIEFEWTMVKQLWLQYKAARERFEKIHYSDNWSGHSEAEIAENEALARAHEASGRLRGFLATAFFIGEPPTVGTRRRIGKVTVDYHVWEQNNRQLKSDLTFAEETMAKKRVLADTAVGDLDRDLATVRAAASDLAAARDRRSELSRQLGRTTPLDSEKSPEYREIEKQIQRAEARLKQIFEIKKALLADKSEQSVKQFDALDEEQRRIEREQQARLKRKAALEEAMALTGTVRDLEASLLAADDFVLVTGQKYESAMIHRDTLARAADRAGDDLRGAERDHAVALAAWNRLGAGSSVLVKRITVTDGGKDYEAEIWNPRPELERLDTRIVELRKTRDAWFDYRWKSREEMIRFQDKAIKARSATTTALWKSTAAQALVETGFYAYDLWEKGSKAGSPAGALGEAVKKLTLAVAFDSYPKFAEFQPPEPAFDFSSESMRAAVQPSRKAMANHLAVGPAIAIAVAKYVESESAKVLTEEEKNLAGLLAGQYWRPLEPVTWSDGLVKYVAARAKFLESLKKGLLLDSVKGIVKNGVSKVLKDLVKNAAKEEIKQRVANYIEGPAYLALMEAEATAGISSGFFMLSSAGYWSSVDRIEEHVALRREIVAKYDPANHMKVLTTSEFNDKSDLTIQLDLDGDPSDVSMREFQVLVGNVQADRPDPKKLVFTVPREKFFLHRHDGQGNVALTISAIR